MGKVEVNKELESNVNANQNHSHGFSSFPKLRKNIYKTRNQPLTLTDTDVSQCYARHRTRVEAIENIQLKTSQLKKKLSGTFWGANIKILRQDLC